jgi:hypothetical protein
VIKVDERQITLELLDLGRHGEISNSSNMFVQGPDTPGIYRVAKKVHCPDGKNSPHRVNLKTNVLEEGEELVQVIQVFLYRLAGDHMIIHRREDKG